MSIRRRTHARYPQSQTDEFLRKHSDKHGDAVSVAEPGVVKMQHLIGNQAVQRLLQRDMQPTKKAVVQRAPGDNKKEEESRPSAVATIELGSGKVEGKSKVAGHEGKLEIMSIQRGVDLAGNVFVTFMRYSDELSAKFQEASVKGLPVKTAKFEIIRYDDDGKANVALSMDFVDGHISAYEVSSHEGIPIESITITFGPEKKEKGKRY